MMQTKPVDYLSCHILEGAVFLPNLMLWLSCNLPYTSKPVGYFSFYWLSLLNAEPSSERLQ